MESLQPALYTTSAHVFQIDPETKKSWMPISKQAVPVALYYDSESSLYKISCSDGSKTLINSTFYPGITFTKTSQKFGQWADAKLNTVYGLGFPNDKELNNFTDKFNEIKKNLRMGVAPILSTMVQIVTPPGTPREPSINSNSGSVKSISSNSTGSVDDGHQSPGSHRSSSSSSESQIKYENDRLKKALAQSSANAKKWESEFQTLKNNNARLTAALQESAINVEKWKEQLNNYKEENARLRKKVASPSSLSSSGQSSHDVNNNESRELEQKLRDTESKLRRKEEELNQLSQHGTKELILLREKNAELQKKLQMLELERRQNGLSQTDKLKQNKSDNTKLNQVNDVRVEMEVKLRELNSLQQKMNSLFK